MRIILTYGLLLVLGGCAVPPETPPPDMAMVKRIIIANKGQLWKDPDSVKSAAITPVFQNENPLLTRVSAWLVCVRANARNSYGGYVGERDYFIALHGGVPEMLVEKRDVCSGRGPYQPFPELEKKS